ncbi:hypothetical protein FTUN_4000 [Frigoriglobus tundricola]|uniref:Uncharacterized protein n=1 Tax=Frigoriglobus tundricola TaxID=2774151 RepID=A0A6M5YSZ8_9BACT|nr:hypothetical protein FTUN_4000 [Frigoriglobus tundricola]
MAPIGPETDPQAFPNAWGRRRSFTAWKACRTRPKRISVTPPEAVDPATTRGREL